MCIVIMMSVSASGKWEDTLMSDSLLGYAKHCQTSTKSSATTPTCCLPQSLPRMVAASLGISCTAVTDSQIQELLMALQLGAVAPSGASMDSISDGFVNEEWMGGDISLATHSRSLLCFDSTKYHLMTCLLSQRKLLPDSFAYDFSLTSLHWVDCRYEPIGIKKGKDALGEHMLLAYDDHLEQVAGNSEPSEPARFIFNISLFHAFFLTQLFRDLYLAGLAFAMLCVCLWFHTGSLCLALCGILHILASVPIAYGIYTNLLGFKVFPYINLIGIFVVAGIGVDDIYVYTDAVSKLQLASVSLQ